MQQFEADGQQSSTTAVGEEGEVADANETMRKYMQQEASQELICRQGHQPLLVAVSRVAPAEGRRCHRSVQRACVVGDRDAMRVGAEVAQNALRTSEGALGVDDPVMAEQSSQPCCEAALISQM